MKPLAQNTMIQNRYLIVQLIGKGGMGEVYLAVDQRLGSAVALKRTFFAGDELLGNAFEREARILARMRHPVLPKVSDHFLEGSEQYLVMEHISGDDLSKRLEAAQKPFPLSWVMFWADQLLDALSYLHSHEPPIIHRDIKPQNLKLTDENHIVLLDFGLSKSSTGNTNIQPNSGSSGSTGSVVGYTPHYAPMEQIRGIGTNPRSDLYSLSATLYQLLTNTVPADALSRADLMLTGKPDPIRPISEINAEVPAGISEVILKGMEVSQDRRFDAARDMQKALRKAFASISTAMAAETVAFNMPMENRAATDVPIAPSMDKTEVMDFGRLAEPSDADSVATRVAGDSQPNRAAEATVAFNADVAEPKQSDLKTEVYNAGDIGVPFAAPADIPVSDQTAENFATRIDSQPGAGGENGFASPPPVDATMPIIAFENSGGAAAEEARPEFDAVSVPVEAPEAKTAAVPAKKGSGGKIVAVFGGLIALFVLGAAAIVGGWYVYNNYYAGAANVQPTPSPEMTPEATPSPEPTIESVYDTNVNTTTDVNSNAAVDANTSTDTNTGQVNTPPATQNNEPRQRPTTQRTPSTRGTAPPETRPTPAPTQRKPRVLQ
ncbi:MAG: protein kinase [Pyrinomonadaceae bacterium]|nr:protein kinase [Pyrinomonadaceae bacterium]